MSPPTLPKGLVVGCCKTSILFVDEQSHLGESILNHGRAPIGRSVINHEYLVTQTGTQGWDHGGQTASKEIPSVVAHDDDREVHFEARHPQKPTEISVGF